MKSGIAVVVFIFLLSMVLVAFCVGVIEIVVAITLWVALVVILCAVLNEIDKSDRVI